MPERWGRVRYSWKGWNTTQQEDAMKRMIGAALAALAISAPVSGVAAQSADDQPDAQQREVFKDANDRKAEARAERRKADEEYRYVAPRIPRGTDIPVTLDEDVAITRENIGDRFEGHITRDVEVNGEVVLVSGAPVEVRLVESGERAEAASLRLDKVHVNGDMRSVDSDVAKADTDERGLGTLEKTAVGAGAGAVVGAVTGVGVLEGAVVGAGGGLAWGLLDGKQGREIEDDTTMRFSLERDLVVD
jgi:hypothetical protein